MHGTDGDFATDFRRAGLTTAEAAAEFGVSERQVLRYLAGECPVPRLTALRTRDIAHQRLAGRPDPAFRFIDLFAGIGGLRLGFEPALAVRCGR